MPAGFRTQPHNIEAEQALLGAILINYAKTYFTGALPDSWLFILGGMFVAVTLFLPKGILGAIPAFPRLRKSPDEATP